MKPEIYGYFNFKKFYKSVTSKYSNGTLFIELGVMFGASLYYLASEVSKRNKNIQIYGIDRWPEGKTIKFVDDSFPTNVNTWDQVYQQAVENMKEFSNVTLIRMESSEAAILFDDETVDFIFLDAGHFYEDVKSDIVTWLPKVKPGGLIAGHDYKNGHAGVEQAVDECFGNKILVTKDNSIWRYLK